MAEPKPTLKDVLAPIMPKLIDQLLRRAGHSTQVELGAKIKSDANTISRYRGGKVVPWTNLPKLGEAAGLSLENTGWLLGSLLVEEYQDASFDLGTQPSEIREPRSRYGKRNLSRELAEVMALDLSPLDPLDAVKLGLERNELRDACEDVLAGRERLIDFLCRQLSAFRIRCETAVRKARAHGPI